MGALVLAFTILYGCALRPHAITVDPNVDFAAHVEHRGLVLDKMPGLPHAVLAPAGWGYPTGGPRYLLRADDKTLAALWFPAPSHMIVRQTADPDSPLLGEVDAAWTQGAIQLTFKPANGPEFQTTVFDRIDGRRSSAALSWGANSVLDVRGTYRAELRDAQGAPAGWLRIRISPYQQARRVYDGVVPAALSGPLLTAATSMLNSEVNYIRNHAVDVYAGN